MSVTLKKIAKIGVEPTLLIKQIDLLTTIRYEMVRFNICFKKPLNSALL